MKTPDVTRLMAWENGELDPLEEAMLFQDLVDSGLAWSLQGMYGRRAMTLIREGIITHGSKQSEQREEFHRVGAAEGIDDE